jgi:hypothetical protein
MPRLRQSLPRNPALPDLSLAGTAGAPIRFSPARIASTKGSPMPQDPKLKRRRPTDDERIDESIDESFPASDPPAHSGVVPGSPRRNEDDGDEDGRERP